jgi:sulfide:quinone oxidoreductase
MDPKQLTPEFSVSGQISPSDLVELAAQGFRSVICNRPDDEDPYQPSFAAIQRAADEAGLLIRYIPVVSGRVTEEDVAQFNKAIDELPLPVLAYCHMGVRSAVMWALSQKGKRPMKEIAATIRRAGL